MRGNFSIIVHTWNPNTWNEIYERRFFKYPKCRGTLYEIINMLKCVERYSLRDTMLLENALAYVKEGTEVLWGVLWYFLVVVNTDRVSIVRRTVR